MDNNYKIEISHRTIIFTVIFLLLIRFLWIVRDLIFSLFIAFIIMSALKPMVTFLSKRKIPRTLAAIVVYFMFLGVFINGFSFIIPPFVKESGQLIVSLPVILENLSPRLTATLNLEAISQYLPELTGKAFSVARNIFSNAVFVISTLFFGFYFLLEESLIKNLLVRFVEEKQTTTVADIFTKAEKRMSRWFWGEILLMLVVGVLTYLGLSLIGIRYALPLAVLAGLLEVVPNLGPTIAAIPAVLIGLSQSYFLGFAALAVAFIVQQLENNMIVPYIMKKATGLNPIVTLIALIIGGRIGGILGVILAIPATLIFETLLIELLRQK